MPLFQTRTVPKKHFSQPSQKQGTAFSMPESFLYQKNRLPHQAKHIQDTDEKNDSIQLYLVLHCFIQQPLRIFFRFYSGFHFRMVLLSVRTILLPIPVQAVLLKRHGKHILIFFQRFLKHRIRYAEMPARFHNSAISDFAPCSVNLKRPVRINAQLAQQA